MKRREGRHKGATNHSPNATFRLSNQEKLKVFQDALEDFEKDNPDWRDYVIVWLAEMGLRRLKAFVEAKTNGKKRWLSPYLDFLYPVEIDWNTWHDEGRIKPNTVSITDDNTSTAEVMGNTFAEGMVRHLTVLALCEFTNWAAFWKRKGGDYGPILSEECAEAYKQVRGRRRRSLFLKKLFHPFALGAGVFEFDDDSTATGTQLSKAQEEDFAELASLIEPPLLSGEIDTDWGKLEFRLIFQAHPLIIDDAKRSSSFQITVGLFIQPKYIDHSAENDPPRWANPANWSASERDEFWATLFSKLKELGTPKDPEMVEAVIAVQAKLKVLIRKSDMDATQKVTDAILNTLNKEGDVLAYGFQVGPEGKANLASANVNFNRLLTETDKSSAADQKGRTLEMLMKALFESVPGFQVRTNIRTETEEIDISILNKSSDTLFSKEGQVILAECKNWTGRCGKDELVLFQKKMINRRRRASLGFLISWNGFANTVEKELLRSSHEEPLVVLLDGEAIRKAVSQGSIAETLQRAYEDAVHL